MGGEHRLARRGFAALLVLGVSFFAMSQQPPLGEARAIRVEPATVGQSPLEPRVRRWLALSLPRTLEVGTRATVRVEGAANAGDELTVFVNPSGEECPSSASAPPEDAISLVSEVTDEGDFRATEAYTPRSLGDRSFCAYLGVSSDDQADIQASASRQVIAKRLRASPARRTVVTALKRHGFAHRVVKEVEPDCHRRNRTEFACEFSAGFPGYQLKGRGRVRQEIGLSYRFRVKAQGVHFILTDENEDPRSG